MDITLRPASVSDHAFVHELNRAAYEALAVRLFGAWDDRVKRERLAAKLGRGGYRIIELAGQAIGAISTAAHGDHIHIDDLMLLPRFQRQGIGSRVLRMEIARAKASNKPLRLHTSRMSDAQHFYRLHGFTETGRSDDFIDFEKRG
ncbi:MAG TPA: GNAT family N-acetyltransferase [Polyangiaceae bacterium]|nr:GNAT family N-acetyltransferase [Polyangiaceae bacterium]HMR76136.1 GNAT family N-acetyltransferase [Polyangiaceae bacterium]